MEMAPLPMMYSIWLRSFSESGSTGSREVSVRQLLAHGFSDGVVDYCGVDTDDCLGLAVLKQLVSLILCLSSLLTILCRSQPV
jgi:hypothetical protein